ncbi:tetratricopeptide repeat protein 8 [Metopolophium dirhodum]|uniref:tetratricopeptide repeat protein 8 n=1 Tax=Metopolophium dirhodum TaxID=44670 RepID=UPI00299030FD|nr:tetratricopeptide repeat protein 8 [Metopolophium dirhodum]XP_060865065.1 tetratricopeptide repeat protein 8 [Metopolophium dirhodum]XP_060865066.1 tetratricopeptide repeat protein 8 [Metopolophium dirhodum]XP_060865067.1 tetratricopeptide repeat protein 8 [Metopolophium dirhodum]
MDDTKVIASLDTFYSACMDLRKHNYDKCIESCTIILSKNPYDQAAWALKMRALTEQLSIDDIEAEEEGIADSYFNSDAIAENARVGTSLRTAQDTSNQRPRTVGGRPLSGIVRPSTSSAGGNNLQVALKTPRTVGSSRPLTSQSARNIRLGTASMVSQIDGPFINISRLNFPKYASDKQLSKLLFNYIYYQQNDIRNALDFAVEATKCCNFEDPWWKVQLGKCYVMLGLLRDGEAQFRSALQHGPNIEVFLRLSRLFIRLDQPLSSLDICQKAMSWFPHEITLLIEMARIFEGLNNIPMSVKYYRDILELDATDMESIACIGLHHFYSDQPEVALRYYRRLLQMGLYNAELFNNLGLCSFYAQQFDVVTACFENALRLALDDNAADVWYNISHVAIGFGDLDIAEHSLHLTLSLNSSHGAALNNLAVLLWRKNNVSRAESLLNSAIAAEDHLYEPHYNRALLAQEEGDHQTSYGMVKKSLSIYPNHYNSRDILNELKKYFSSL